MRKHTYSKFSPELADAVDLQALLDKLADFLLQSGFAGGRQFHPYWGEFGGDEDRSMEALREAILNALMESGQFTPEMLEALSWLGRGALAAKQWDSAEGYAKQTYDLALSALKGRGVDQERHLPIALGAAIEVLAHVRAERGAR